MLAFVFYITLDLSSPSIPGAFSFNPDACVEGVHCASSPTQRADASALSVRTPVVRLELPSPSSVRPSARGRFLVLEWLADAREDTGASDDPPSAADDH